MTQEHPITPPPELVEQWLGIWPQDALMQAARWGADQELEACINYFLEYDSSWGENSELITGLRTLRRPKPPSLKEQALAKLEAMERLWEASGNTPSNIIRRALESLPE